jgi:hypothetical protein
MGVWGVGRRGARERGSVVVGKGGKGVEVVRRGRGRRV